MAKGDPRGRVRCPLCRRTVRGWKGPTGRHGSPVSTYAGVRHALMDHFRTFHPGLDVRERSLLADRALEDIRAA